MSSGQTRPQGETAHGGMEWAPVLHGSVGTPFPGCREVLASGSPARLADAAGGCGTFSRIPADAPALQSARAEDARFPGPARRKAGLLAGLPGNVPFLKDGDGCVMSGTDATSAWHAGADAGAAASARMRPVSGHAAGCGIRPAPREEDAAAGFGPDEVPLMHALGGRAVPRGFRRPVPAFRADALPSPTSATRRVGHETERGPGCAGRCRHRRTSPPRSSPDMPVLILPRTSERRQPQSRIEIFRPPARNLAVSAPFRRFGRCCPHGRAIAGTARSCRPVGSGRLGIFRPAAGQEPCPGRRMRSRCREAALPGHLRVRPPSRTVRPRPRPGPPDGRGSFMFRDAALP
jgi:hypothetical protein